MMHSTIYCVKVSFESGFSGTCTDRERVLKDDYVMLCSGAIVTRQIDTVVCKQS